MSLESRRGKRFVLQLHDRNISFIKSSEGDEPSDLDQQSVGYFKDGKLHSSGNSKASQDAKHSFRSTLALIETLQGSDAYGVDMLPSAKRNGQFNKMAGGLHNPGINICFMNVIIQVLTHSPYLAPAMLRSGHSKVCPNAKRKMVCVTCLLESHIKRALSSPCALKNNFVYIVQKLIWKHYRLGRQEDAFIFLKHFFEALIKGCYGSKYPYTSSVIIPSKDMMQSFIGRIFGCFLLNVVICKVCNYRSEKLETCFDISVDIYRGNKLVDLLSSFVQPELLDSANKYNCPSCKTHQRATKAMSIYRAPRIMNVVLKRFGMSETGCEKSKKEVSFPLSFSMSLNTSKHPQPVWVTYELYAVVCHLGRSLNMGHYITFIKGQHGFWHSYNDSTVTTVSQKAVLGLRQDAYLLFYAVKDECVQICDMLVNDSAITNSFTSDVVSANRNMGSTLMQYRTDILQAESVAEDSGQQEWPACNIDEGLYRRVEISKSDDSDTTPGGDPVTIDTSTALCTKPEDATDSPVSGPALEPDLATDTSLEDRHGGPYELNRIRKRFVTRKRHGYKLRLMHLFRQHQVAAEAVDEIMRIKDRLMQHIHEQGSTSPEVEVEINPGLLYAKEDNVGTWSDAEPDAAYHELDASIHPPLPKRSQDDIDYDRGKVKKVRVEPQRPLGMPQIVQHRSGVNITVHQKDAFDRLVNGRHNTLKRGGARFRGRRKR
ncbi:ubiquitin carboxyl-terminal hydrolase family protein [Babesia bovis T2Bo]|uniref:ubiquitinyl hydrolase 1 n=1 Tax=Babesia bovis TaxID=5865 RepID=A7ANP5_BABBO|nr:ubiquitin carboxyl-terminal hydrolase family protein [Babesia bovis T2Bo]EDO08179.1 ubiquitin carboxyl-terminal hydrolase family protein [Babesia bovis T2Bo]|eukprot:XP_001611747.1 ubiquitin carboxyl-terminal hydrolase family protein [Babesia bovis T2Bo]